MHLLRRCSNVLLALLVLRAIPLAAQSSSLTPQPQTKGLALGVHLGTTLLDVTRTESQPGIGGGIMVGYGLTRHLQVFTNLDVSLIRIFRDPIGPYYNVSVGETDVTLHAQRATRSVSPDEDAAHSASVMDVVPFYDYLRGNNTFVHFDVGARYSVVTVKQRLMPYVATAFTYRQASVPYGGTKFTTSGNAFTLGVGTQYYVKPTVALDLGLQASRGTTAPKNGYAAAGRDPVYTKRISLGTRYYLSPF